MRLGGREEASKRRSRWVVGKVQQIGCGRERTEPNLTLGIDSIYYIRNNTCINLRIKGLNIYMYRRWRILKKSLKKYNNKKD
jgi:hypothetical protein